MPQADSPRRRPTTNTGGADAAKRSCPARWPIPPMSATNRKPWPSDQCTSKRPEPIETGEQDVPRRTGGHVARPLSQTRPVTALTCCPLCHSVRSSPRAWVRGPRINNHGMGPVYFFHNHIITSYRPSPERTGGQPVLTAS